MTDGWEVMARAEELLNRGEDFALATVVWRQPPTSGKQGSRAIITRDGQLHGWIGGACAEPIVIREAKSVMAEHEARLVLIGRPGQFGGMMDGGEMDGLDGAVFRPMTCASEGALQVYVEPVEPAPRLVVVGRSPMAQTLVDLAAVLGWRAALTDAGDFDSDSLTSETVVVVATQGHGDEEAVEAALTGSAAYVGLVASRKRGSTVREFLVERGLGQDVVDRLRVPVGLDLGHTTHREIAVAVLAELVKQRAEGGFHVSATEDDHVGDHKLLPIVDQADAIDPVCGMTVAAADSSYPHEHDGITYWFCCLPCQTKFAADPAVYLTEV